jgi:hypothetical protein
LHIHTQHVWRTPQSQTILRTEVCLQYAITYIHKTNIIVDCSLGTVNIIVALRLLSSMLGYEPWRFCLAATSLEPRSELQHCIASNGISNIPTPSDMASTTSSAPTCPVLKGPLNFTIWNIHIRSVLSEKQVLGVVTGTDLKPADPPAISTTSKSASGSKSADPGSISITSSTSKISYSDMWEARDEKATGLIQRFLSNSILLSIRNKKSAKELYDSIVRRYNEMNVITTTFHALSDLISLKYKGSPSTKSMSEHTASFYTLNNCLTSLGYQFHEDLLLLLLLKSVPDNENWRTLKTAITGSVTDGSKLKVEEVESKLAAHAASLQRTNESASQESGGASVESALKVSKTKRKSFFCKLHGENFSHNTPEC